MTLCTVDTALLVIAKQPIPGRVKTRLTPPCTPEQAATIAAAALLDTLAAVAAVPAARHVLVFDGDPRGWVPEGFDVIAQRGAGLDERLQAAFEDVNGPALLVGMDTPQLTTAHVRAALAALDRADAVLAPTDDGGYWCVGFAAAVRPGAFTGVPMSTDHTYADQLQRLHDLGLSVAVEGRLRDVDDITAARLVAADAPTSRFAAALAATEASASCVAA